MLPLTESGHLLNLMCDVYDVVCTMFLPYVDCRMTVKCIVSCRRNYSHILNECDLNCVKLLGNI